jgi:hypothetical protein
MLYGSHEDSAPAGSEQGVNAQMASPEYRAMFEKIEKAFGRVISGTEMGEVLSWINDYGVDPDYVAFAVEYCAKKKKKTVTPNRESNRENNRPNIPEKENKPQNNEPKVKEHAPIAEKGKEGDNRNKADKGRNKYHNNRKPNGPREKRVENPSENPIKKGANEKTQPQN